MKKVIAIMLMIIIFLTNSNMVLASKENTDPPKKEKQPKVTAKSAILIDATTGAILYEKKQDTKRYPASITKLMTILLALEHSSIDEKVTFSHNAIWGIERGSSNIGITEGEILTMEQCLYGIMLESANEVCLAVAEHISGSVEEFAKLMNKRAKELGCKNTNFTNPNGLPDESHYTTAYDMALITKAVLDYDLFRTVASTRNYMIPKTNLKKEKRPLWNHHKMIKYPQSSIYGYDGTQGGKTGYTTVARGTLVTYAKRGDLELICVVLKCEGTNIYYDTKTLFDYGFNNYQYYTPDNKMPITHDTSLNIIDKNFYLLAKPQRLDLYIDKNFGMLIPSSIKPEQIVRDVTIKPDNQTNTFGQINYSYKEELLGTNPIHYKNFIVPGSISKDSNEENFLISNKYIITTVAVLVLLIVLIILRILLHKKRRRLRHRGRNRRNNYY